MHNVVPGGLQDVGTCLAELPDGTQAGCGITLCIQVNHESAKTSRKRSGSQAQGYRGLAYAPL